MHARRLRKPSVLLWVLGLVLAALVGLAVAGPPGGARDVPLRDRDVPTTEPGCGDQDATCFFGSTTTTTTAPAPPPTTAPVETAPTDTADGAGEDGEGGEGSDGGTTAPDDTEGSTTTDGADG